MDTQISYSSVSLLPNHLDQGNLRCSDTRVKCNVNWGFRHRMLTTHLDQEREFGFLSSLASFITHRLLLFL